ncbi:MAG: DUF4416 family protein [Deltaproteobacteria bacterium]|nr:DUF4416 family protein [Deltaproteobacteria bacterium]
MSRRKVPSPAGLLFSVIYRKEEDFEKTFLTISDRIGKIGYASSPFPFDRTDYYAKEMGTPLFRRFLLAADAVCRDELVQAKIASESIEDEFRENGNRTVNIDPGLLSEESFVLATGKPYSHRIYLRDGVFADLTLVFEKGEYKPLPWTYPDLASPEIRTFLTMLRTFIRKGIHQGQRGDSCRCG